MQEELSRGETALSELELEADNDSEGVMESEGRSYPEMPGEPDCAYYMRTGHCGFGMNCRFNHPMSAALPSSTEEYPERVGQPECQYFLKTGMCKYGTSCKYHHPKEKVDFRGKVAYNVYGLPLRLGEKICVYYMKTGNCKFGKICRFHHPEPAAFGSFAPISGPPLYETAAFPMESTAQPYLGSAPSFKISISPFHPLLHFKMASSFQSLVFPHQCAVQVPSWPAYQSSIGSALSPVGPQQNSATNYIHGSVFHQNNYQSGVYQNPVPYFSGPPESRIQSNIGPREVIFPERPGQPECSFYLKTGDCKYGMTCKYNHPKERMTPMANCLLSIMGLPLRPGAQLCTFYSRYGICKYGAACKFNHPLEYTAYSPSVSSVSVSDMPIPSFIKGTLSPLTPEVPPPPKPLDCSTKDE